MAPKTTSEIGKIVFAGILLHDDKNYAISTAINS